MYLMTRTVCTKEGKGFRLEARSGGGQELLTMLPARPPAMRANPTKRNNLARHATPPELQLVALQSAPPSSAIRRDLSIRLTMIMPSVAHRPGVQSAKLTRTGTGSYGESSGFEIGLAYRDVMVASRNAHHPNANWEESEGGVKRRIEYDYRARALTSAPAR